MLFAGMFAMLVACGRPASPPEPPILVEPGTAEGARLSPVRDVQVVHRGCFGRCPIYTVKLCDDGTWAWEGSEVGSQAARVTGMADASEIRRLFGWLADHPALYAASADRVRCLDCEIVEFTFGLRSGESIVVEYGMGFDGDDYWALSKLVDAIIERERSR